MRSEFLNALWEWQSFSRLITMALRTAIMLACGPVVCPTSSSSDAISKRTKAASDENDVDRYVHHAKRVHPRRLTSRWLHVDGRQRWL